MKGASIELDVISYSAVSQRKHLAAAAFFSEEKTIVEW